MKDDLVDGREILRLDGLERLEMTAVQLDEVRGFLARETVSHDRLALILLDNAAEVIMRRSIEVALSSNMLMERLRDRWKKILACDPGNVEARRIHDEVQGKIVPRSLRRELASRFDASVDFIRDRGGVQETEARVLKKLHKYRNEVYHRDRVRPQTVRSACLLYFDLTCTLFEGLPQYEVMPLSFHKETPPTLLKFNAPGVVTGYPTEEQVAASLRSGLGIDNAGIKETLSAHLTARLDDLDAVISRIQDMLFGEIPQLAPAGPWRQLVIHLAQWKGGELPASSDELLAVQPQYGEADLASWRQGVEALQELTGRLEQFAAFADIEDAFEPFEEEMAILDIRIEREMELELDALYGK